ncbi:MAG: hypothetical protein FD180_3062 [Planctomycetota bacterium]|nr:MAG: hypothetical protein FD180_3062 [Planctomycetota bacterium]
MDNPAGASPVPASSAPAAKWILLGCVAAGGVAVLLLLVGVALYFAFRSAPASGGGTASSGVRSSSGRLLAAESGVVGESDGEWQPVAGARVEGDRIVAEARDFCDCAVTQPDGSSGPEEMRHRLVHTEEWRASVEITISGSRDVDYGNHSEQFTVSRSAALTARLRNRFRDSKGVVTWSANAKDPAVPGEEDASVQVADGGFETDWDHDNTGNVFYYFSTTCSGGPCRRRAPFTLRIDLAKGIYSLSGSVEAGKLIHRDDNSREKMWEEPLGVLFGLHERPFKALKGVIADSVELTEKDSVASIGGDDPNEPIELERRGRVTVTLTPGAPLLARIRGPFTFKRAESVTLDGSDSLGEIAEYRWRVDFDGREGPPADLTGQKVTFRALTTFKAVLEVTSKSGGKDTTKPREFEVQPRTGPDWKTKFHTKRGDDLTSRMSVAWGDSMGGLELGINECAKCPPGKNTGHQLHRSPDTNTTWIDVGYELEELQDGGPFDGYFYVLKQQFEVDRVERVNVNLKPEGEVEKLNRVVRNFGKVPLLLSQVQTHEEVHSKLTRETLNALKTGKKDPARRVEAVVGRSRQAAQDGADFCIRDAEGDLVGSTTEKKVKERMEKDGGFGMSIEVFFPRASFEQYKDREGVKRTLGPLHSLGDDLQAGK